MGTLMLCRTDFTGFTLYLTFFIALIFRSGNIEAQQHSWTLGWESYVQKQYHKNLSATGFAVIYEQPLFKPRPIVQPVLRVRIGQADGMLVQGGRESMHFNAGVESMLRFSILEKSKVSPVLSAGGGIQYRKSISENPGSGIEPTLYSVVLYPTPVLSGGGRIKIRKTFLTACLHVRRTNDIDEWGYSVVFRW
jgi:hypothetical protein